MLLEDRAVTRVVGSSIFGTSREVKVGSFESNRAKSSSTWEVELEEEAAIFFWSV